jgi:hypothetical protein
MFSYRAGLWQYEGREWVQIGVNKRNRDGELHVRSTGDSIGEIAILEMRSCLVNGVATGCREPQRLEAACLLRRSGTAEAVTFPKSYL